MKKLVKKDEIGINQPVGNTVGLDLGDHWSRYCVLDQNVTIVKEGRVRTTLEALKEQFGGMPATRIIIEAGTHSPWVSRELKRQGHSVTVANARKVRLIYESDRKNDRMDARMLARLGRLDIELLSPIQSRSAVVEMIRPVNEWLFRFHDPTRRVTLV